MCKILLFLLICLIFPNSCCYSENQYAETDEFSSSAVFVKVLLYHNVTPNMTNADNPYVIRLSVFEEQIKWLYENDIDCLTVSEMFEKLSAGVIRRKTAVITFDDGYPDIYTYAFPVLKAYGVPATTYLVGEKIDTPKNLTGDMIHELYESGWEIGSHSMTHSDLTEHDDLDTEICRSRSLISLLSNISADDVTTFAYPYGNTDEIVTSKVWKCGYHSGAGLGQIPVDTNQNPYYFPRHPVTSGMSFEEFTALFN